MKKIAAMILVLMLLIGCSLAESVNGSDQGVSSGRTLREGKFIIGEDLPAGNYTITCISTAGEAAGAAYGSIGSMMDAFDGSPDGNWGNVFGSFGGLMSEYIDMTVEIIGNYGDVLKSYNMKAGDSFIIKLEEGTALRISDGSCTIQPN